MSAEEKNVNESEQALQDEALETVEQADADVVESTDAPEEAASADAQVAVMTEELSKLKEQVLRSEAEMENVRRRAELDVEKAHKFALEKFTKELLPIADSLEKAIESIQGDDAVLVSAREGVEMTLNLMMSALGKFKVEQLDPVGEPFDPQYHEAMSMVSAPHAEPNSVIAVVQKGYTLHGRLVRPAMVMVAKAEAGNQIDEKA
ncbi:heat shock protein [Oleiphilus messinensis]|uniref:Protein GrpE n=1 Tax=Oleiphilus messinensis TaxID=141451 RepID=A0A1Y0I5R7_9GAMM|nr:nucleotide exchange factor GrpE [Oleiphilus messinensis]ARU55559.1 heat shock protein [Oleiphilus messinensis]